MKVGSIMPHSSLPNVEGVYPGATALTIAGSDPSGGAGLQADLKTFQQLNVFGMSVVTLITVQNTQAVTHVELLSTQLIVDQLNAVVSDIPPSAVKTGALGSAAIVGAVGEQIAQLLCPIVVDPVLVSKHGHRLVTEDVVEAYARYLIPHAMIVTPNRFEAECLSGIPIKSEDAAAEAISTICRMGARHVLIKLGDVHGESHHVFGTGTTSKLIRTRRLSSTNTHGTGCILAAAITAKLALAAFENQADRQDLVLQAAEFGIQKALEAIAFNSHLGKGISPADVRGFA